MKRVIILAVAMAVAATVSAQNLGVRVGAGLEASYKYSLDEKTFAEGNVGLNNWYRGLQLTATYNKYLLETDLAGLHLNIYAGGGVALAYRWNDDHKTVLGKMTGYTDTEGNAHKHTSAFIFGVVGQAGAEYKFPNMPMTIALEYRPMLGLATGRFAGKEFSNDITTWKKSRFYTPGLFDFGVVVRYKF